MSESTRVTILLILGVVLFGAIVFVISNYLLRRAIKGVIKILRDAGAVSSETAKTTEELGFSRKLFNFKLIKDYRPSALQLLLTAGIIMQTDDGRIYLSEENLSRTKLGQQP